jgi:CHAT domain-containing protein
MRRTALFVLVTILLGTALGCFTRDHNEELRERTLVAALGEESGCISGASGQVNEREAFNAAIRGILEEHAEYELLMYEKHLYGYINSHELPPGVNPLAATADDIDNYLAQVDPIAAPAAILVYWRTKPKREENTSLCAGLVLSGKRMIVQSSPVSESEKLAELLKFDRATDARAATPRSLQPSQAAARLPMDLKALSRALLPPRIAAAIEARRVKTLLVIPIGEIGAAPFPALPLPGGHQLIDFADVVIAPGFYTLRYPTAEAAVRSSNPMLIIGDPFLANDPKWNFPPLPGARLEVQQVGELFGKQPLVGTAATKAKVVSALRARPGPQLIYFATHAIADPVNPQDGSFLALDGGNLYTRDIGKLHLKGSPLIVLSACQTGLGKVFDGPGIFGMALAWQYAGAGNVVISMWNVPDLPTRDLMIDFTRRVQRGEHTTTALSQSMRTLRSRDSETVDWAGFSVFGDLPMKTAP